MRSHSLRDDQWVRICGLLPGRAGHVGVTAADNRLFVEAVLFRYRAGSPWRDLPERFGDWKNVHRRFSHLATDTDNEYGMINSTVVRANQHISAAQKKSARTKRSAARAAD